MNNLIFNAGNYSDNEKKILESMIAKLFFLIDKECAHNDCDNRLVRHLCIDTSKNFTILLKN